MASRRQAVSANRGVSRPWPAGMILAALLACGDAPDGAKDSARASDTSNAAGAATGTPPADSALDRAARQAVGFLRGEVPADSLALADTVELRAAPEGGGAARRVPRQALAERAAWAVEIGGRRVALAPPAGYSAVSTSVGRHFNCQEQDLASRAPDLAARPHVGVRLQPDSAASCLQSWNSTFVFDTTAGGLRLTAVLYDQWEW